MRRVLACTTMVSHSGATKHAIGGEGLGGGHIDLIKTGVDISYITVFKLHICWSF